ncbi:MAG: FlgO family outer membrane protein [Desulfohalobiaceae bacterium]
MRTKHLIGIILLVLFAAQAISCAPSRTESSRMERYQTPNIVQANNEAVDELLGSCNIFLDQKEPLIVTTLVDIDDLNRSSTLGRMSSEMISNRLVQHGYQVKEVKMGEDIFVDKAQGEFILSRELKKIGQEHEVQGFIVGTYAVSDQRLRYFKPQVAVSLRLVDVENIVGCSHNYTIQNTDISMWE